MITFLNVINISPQIWNEISSSVLVLLSVNYRKTGGKKEESGGDIIELNTSVT